MGRTVGTAHAGLTLLRSPLVGHLMRDLVRVWCHKCDFGTTPFTLGRKHPIRRVSPVWVSVHLERVFFRRDEITVASSIGYWISTYGSIYAIHRLSSVANDRRIVSDYGMKLETKAHHPTGKIRGKLGFPAYAPLIGMVYIMYTPKWYPLPRYGLKMHEDLLDAFAIALKKRPDAGLGRLRRRRLEWGA